MSASLVNQVPTHWSVPIVTVPLKPDRVRMPPSQTPPQTHTPHTHKHTQRHTHHLTLSLQRVHTHQTLVLPFPPNQKLSSPPAPSPFSPPCAPSERLRDTTATLTCPVGIY